GSRFETNGTIVSYHWGQLAGPSTATFGNASLASTTVGGLVQGTYTFQITVTDALGKTAGATVQVTVNAAAVVPGTPSAGAGSNVTLTLPTNSVNLAGSGSETNGTIVSYAWTQVSGPSTATISTATQAATKVSGLVQGIYIFKLTVTDNSGKTASATVQVTVNAAAVVPGPPSANAGSNQTISLPTNSVILTGVGSETNGAIVSYSWTQVSGPSTATFGSANQSSTVVDGLVQGTYSFRLTVTDNSSKTASATVSVTVNPAPVVLPVLTANAGPNQTIILPTNSTTLTGSGTLTDASATIVAYSWVEAQGPSTATIGSPNSAITTISGLVEGIYSFRVTVQDNMGRTANATVAVTVNPGADQSPVAMPGANRTVTQSATPVVLNGSASYDPDGSIVAYNWVQLQGAGGVTIANQTTATPSIYGMQIGTYVYQLTVTDNQGVTNSADITITVVGGATTPVLVANAGAADTIHLPVDTVTLDGTGSTVSSGTIVGYSWQQVSGPSTATIGNSAASATQVSDLKAGTYTFRLTVTDSNGDTASATVNV